MTKHDAIKLFGTRQQDLADAVGVSRGRIGQWPDVLTQRQIDIVTGAAVRLGVLRRGSQPAPERVA